ncbi:MAG: hypothetical protein ACLQHT_12380 [Terracidiphilus sp.]
MAFSSSDASEWDQCTPSVAACRAKAATGVVTLPDLGDLWRVEWNLLAANAEAVTLVGECFSLQLVLERSVRVSGHDKRSRLGLEHKLAHCPLFERRFSIFYMHIAKQNDGAHNCSLIEMSAIDN